MTKAARGRRLIVIAVYVALGIVLLLDWWWLNITIACALFAASVWLYTTKRAGSETNGEGR